MSMLFLFLSTSQFCSLSWVSKHVNISVRHVRLCVQKWCPRIFNTIWIYLQHIDYFMIRPHMYFVDECIFNCWLFNCLCYLCVKRQSVDRCRCLWVNESVRESSGLTTRHMSFQTGHVCLDTMPLTKYCHILNIIWTICYIYGYIVVHVVVLSTPLYVFKNARQMCYKVV